jgi:hypothetical protein
MEKAEEPAPKGQRRLARGAAPGCGASQLSPPRRGGGTVQSISYVFALDRAASTIRPTVGDRDWNNELTTMMAGKAAQYNPSQAITQGNAFIRSGPPDYRSPAARAEPNLYELPQFC